MKANYIVGTIVLIVLVLIGAVTYSAYKNRSSDTIDIDELPVPSPLEGFASPSATPTSLGVNSQPATGESDNSEDGLQIMEPGLGEYLANPFRVRGYINKSAGDVQISILNVIGENIAVSTVPCISTLDRNICEFSALFENINVSSQTGSVKAASGSFSDSVSVNFN